MTANVKPWILDLEPYVPGTPIDEVEREFGIRDAIKLASNENPLGPSPRALEAIHEAAADVNRYPDGSSFRLRDALSDKLDVPPDHLVFATGSSELLELLAKLFLGPQAEIVCPWPSFAMYPIVAQGMGARTVQVPLTADLEHDLDAMLAAVNERTQLVIVCNPNNPTGTSIGSAAFDRFAAALPADVILVIDEAYVEYARRDDFPDALGWVRRRPNTIVLRTFSKIYGLAGLRVGYSISDPDLAGFLERARHPFNVNLLAQAAACAALQDSDHVARSRQANCAGANALVRELDALGVRTWPTDANYVLVQAGDGAADALQRLGVIVRGLAGFGLPDCIRVTIGTPEENEKFVKAMATLCSGKSR